MGKGAFAVDVEERERRKVFRILPGQVFPRPPDGALAMGIEVIDGDLADGTAVVVSFDDGGAPFADEGDAFVRCRAIADDIPQAVDAVH